MLDKNNIEKQFNMVAEEYDMNRRRFIPCYDDFYINTTALIAANIDAPERIIDLGTGTGLLSEHWYRHFSGAEYILTDIAEDMLEVAKRRFSGLEGFSYKVADYLKGLPDVSADTVISALSIHHLEDDEKQVLFGNIYNALPDGGLFVNYDQFCAVDDRLSRWYDRFWEGQLYNSGLTDKDIALWQARRKLDRECSVEQEINMLRKSGFSMVECVYSYHKFAVIAALK